LLCRILFLPTLAGAKNYTILQVNYMKKTIALFTCLIFIATAFANITLPKIFGDNMVLQRNKPINVWGFAAAGEKVTVLFDGQTKNTKAGKDGKWLVTLAAEKEGGPFELSVKGKNLLTIKNILIGEVWICSGQSNMEMPIEGWGKINNYQQEINDANYPQIRHFKVPNTVSTTLKDDITGGDWKVCSPATASEFSATAYFFARQLYNQLKVPVGLINTSWGGTMSEAWTSEAAFAKSAELKYVADAMKGSDIETMLKQRGENMRKAIQKAQGSFENNANTTDWKNIAFDDSKWPSMKLPGLWETQGLPDVDGTVWFRKTIAISDADAGKAATLNLAMIDDNDEAFVNGVKVGSTNAYNAVRKYPIAAGILKAGKNTIAVKVGDTGGGGGIYGPAADLSLIIDNKPLPLSGDWLFQVAAVSQAATSVGPNDYPSMLFNAMLYPLVQYGIAGAIWYQGETNAGRAYQYRTAFPLMITDWREHFKQGNFPFLFVQLSTFGSAESNSTNGSNWAELREAQAMTLSLPHTGMAVTTDIGNPADIHPKNKQDVGKRLATIALHDIYQQPGESTGPVFQSMKAEGGKVILTFTHIGGGLLVKDKYGYLKGFEVAGADKHFRYAKAFIQGDNVIVSADGISQPLAVRYNWADDASEGNLFNKEQFPAAPFRTDDWEGVTVKSKYTIGL
jgi:sialate O-acetylesterase